MKFSVLLFVFSLIASPALRSQTPASSNLTQPETAALVLAVQDEIYDYAYQEDYFPEGGPVGDLASDSQTQTRVPLYVDPILRGDEGRAIYKLMPYGEVIRRFHIRRDGIAVLDGDPEIGFPASQVNRKTVYLKDSDLCVMKRDWAKSSFEIDLSPSPERIRDAVRRQKQRTGFSKWEFAHAKGPEKR